MARPFPLRVEKPRFGGELGTRGASVGPYLRVKDANGVVTVWRKEADNTFSETQTLSVRPDGAKLVNGLPRGKKEGEADLHPVGYASKLPGGVEKTGGLGPFGFIQTMQASARKSTVVGIAAIGFFYVLTLFLGLGAMTSGALDVTDSNMSAPLLARSISELLFAVISAVAFTTVLGTVSGLIMAASGAVAHDLMTNFLKVQMDDFQKVRAAKVAAMCVGMVAIVPFSQPAIVTIPLGFLVLVVVSLLTQPRPARQSAAVT